MTAADHLARLAARGRPTGSAAIAEAREYCATVLRDAGYRVVEEPFEYSQFPGRLGTPLGGAFIVLAVTLAGAFGMRSVPGMAVGLLAGAMILVALAGAWLARRGTSDLPVMRARGVNLTCERPARPARVW